MGQSDLNYLANTDTLRFGDFVATEYGESLIPVLMKPRQLIVEIGKSIRARTHGAQADGETRRDVTDMEHPELEAALARRAEVRLLMRAPDGSLVDTEDIDITDLDWLLSISSDEELEDDWRSDLMLAEEEFLEELEPAAETAASFRVDAAPWVGAERELDEFDVPDLEFLGTDDVEVNEPPRYQIQVAIRCLPGRTDPVNTT